MYVVAFLFMGVYLTIFYFDDYSIAYANGLLMAISYSLQFRINTKLTQNNTELSFLTFNVFVKGKIAYK